ncbi:hypothetical protein [Actinomyces viscosus]|uniref:Uncharacterized protein n=1 Tax=Actinomyces viscosus TaxID=1656 RepID=A0A3S4WK80_ACTVI|nr:Uncharacterised protein [Actinomyces viscosus]
MGPGWITVVPEAIADDEHLTFWVDAAMSHNRVIAGRESRSKNGARRS